MTLAWWSVQVATIYFKWGLAKLLGFVRPTSLSTNEKFLLAASLAAFIVRQTYYKKKISFTDAGHRQGSHASLLLDTLDSNILPPHQLPSCFWWLFIFIFSVFTVSMLTVRLNIFFPEHTYHFHDSAMYVQLLLLTCHSLLLCPNPFCMS